MPINYFCSCAFVGTPTTSDHWELIKIGQYRLESGRAVGARNVFKKALLEAEKHNDKFALTVIHNDLGLTYIRENEDTAKAEKHYTIAREIAESNRFRYELAYNYLNYAQLWKILDVNDNSCAFIQKAFVQLKDLSENPSNPPFGESISKIDKLTSRTKKFAEEAECKNSITL